MTIFSGSYRPNKETVFNDSDGNDSSIWRNNKGFPVVEINSKGDIIRKGRSVKR